MTATRKSRKKPSKTKIPEYLLRLYVAGEAPNSRLAINNLEKITGNVLSHKCEIEIIDVLEEPERALVDNIIVAPTLIRVSPVPEKRIVGNLNDNEMVINALDL